MPKKIIEDYVALPHDAIGADHQGCYHPGTDGIVYDSSYHCSSLTEEQHAMLAILFIEKWNTLDFSEGNPKIKTINGKVSFLKKTKSAKWEVGGGLWVALKKAAAWVANISLKLSIGIIELPLTLLVEPFLFGYRPQFFNYVREIATSEIIIKNPAAPRFAFDNLLKEIRRAPETLGLRIRHFAVVAFKNSFEDIFHGVRDIYKQFSVHLFDSILDDYLDGKGSSSFEDVLRASDCEIEEIARSMREPEKYFLGKTQTDLSTPIGEFIEPAFISNAGEFDDILNSSVDGVEKFMALYSHNIYAKNPFTGMLFSLSYVVAGLAVLVPHYVAFLGSQYIAYSKAMGYSMSKSSFSAAISSAITQAQMTSSIFELLIHGHDSWLAKGTVGFEKDPFTSLCYVGTALGLGYAVLDIPAVGRILKEDMGTFPPSSLAFVGAKLGVLVYELLMEHHEFHLDHTVSAGNLKAYLTEIYKKNHENESNAIVADAVKDIFDQVFTAENMKKLQEAYQGLQQQNVKTIEGLPPEMLKDYEKLLTQAKILKYLMENGQHLSYLSTQTKHRWVQQLLTHFSSSQARSLKNMLYPTEHTSILRTTLRIIFGYPAFMIRAFAAVISSIRWRNVKPFQGAITDFGLKILKDVTRVGRALSRFLKIVFSFVRRQGKTFADVLMNSFLARGQALIANRHTVANATYAASAAIDVSYEKARQLFSTPMDAAIKAVTAPDPINIHREITTSYVKMLRNLLNGEPPREEKPSLQSPEFSEESKHINHVKQDNSDLNSVKDSISLHQEAFALS